MNFEKVKEAMIDTLHCDREKITMDARLSEDLNIDSLDAVELIMTLEEEYGIKISDAELEKMKKVSDIVDCIEKYQNQET